MDLASNCKLFGGVPPTGSPGTFRDSHISSKFMEIHENHGPGLPPGLPGYLYGLLSQLPCRISTNNRRRPSQGPPTAARACCARATLQPHTAGDQGRARQGAGELRGGAHVFVEIRQGPGRVVEKATHRRPGRLESQMGGKQASQSKTKLTFGTAGAGNLYPAPAPRSNSTPGRTSWRFTVFGGSGGS